MSIEELVGRLEKLTGPSSNVDEVIAHHLFGEPTPMRLVGQPESDPSLNLYANSTALRYTASLDAALTLVPEGWSWRVQNEYGGEALGVVADKDERYAISHPQPILALVIAALRSRASEKERT